MSKNNLSEISSLYSNPAQIILSGEHSVLYNKKAIILPVNQYITESKFELISNKYKERDAIFHILSDQINYNKTITYIDIEKTGKQIDASYKNFLTKQIDIKSVLGKSENLIIYTIYKLCKKYPIIKNYDIKITVKSNIPINYGLGSSAALITSLLNSAKNFIKILYKLLTNETINIDLNIDELARNVENIIHANSSGINTYIANKKTACYLNKTYEIIKSYNLNLFLIFTGNADASTGESVAQVKNNFLQSDIWNDFANITDEIYDSIKSDNNIKLKKYIKHNHKLLCSIGIVPPKIQSFISECEKYDGAGKICGAGSIKGNKAGIIALFIDNEKYIADLTKKYNYNYENIQLTNNSNL